MLVIVWGRGAELVANYQVHRLTERQEHLAILDANNGEVDHAAYGAEYFFELAEIEVGNVDPVQVVLRGGVVGQLHRDSAVRGGAKPHVAEMVRLQALELLSFLRDRSGGRKEQVQPVKDWLGRVALTGCIGLPFDGVRDVVRKALEHLMQNT